MNDTSDTVVKKVSGQHLSVRHEVRRRSPAEALTLVELLVVIAIIGTLESLLLPAVQMPRESARRITCTNNLKQQALAIRLHEEQHRTYPTGDCGTDWIGDYETTQAGGWICDVPDLIDQQNLRDLGKGLKRPEKRQDLALLMETPSEVFNCPSRHLPRLYPYKGPSTLQNADPQEKIR